LATLVLIAAGLNRVLFNLGLNPSIGWLHVIGIANVSLSGQPNLSAFLIYDDLLLIPLLVYDFLTIRGIHKITLMGSTCIIGIHLMLTILWGLMT
jgi:hypothetical protein